MEMGEKNVWTHSAKLEIGKILGQRKARKSQISVISDQGMSRLNLTNSRQMKELHRYFTCILLLIAVQWDKTIRSVFTTSHQFPDHAGNTHRTEFQFPCWVFWSRVLTHCALRVRKQFREISLTWDIWEWKVWVGGWNAFPFHLKQTKKNLLAQGTHRESYCWKCTFCFRGCPHFWQYPFICLAGYSRKLFWCNNIELNTKKNASKFIFGCIYLWRK